MNWYRKFNKIAQKESPIFVGTYLPDDFYDKYDHISGLEEDAHMTLLYLPSFNDTEENRKKILDLVNNFADNFPPIECEIAGICLMNNDNNTLILNIDAKGAEIFHVDLLRLLEKNGIEVKRNHGFLPHVTLKYENKENIDKNKIKDYAWTIKNISIVFNKEEDMKYEFELKGENKEKLAYKTLQKENCDDSSHR